ncbi:MAG: ECF transporter S component [Clostridiales bacterium]|nr:ECF transporter S component [Clostridiales bacterium]
MNGSNDIRKLVMAAVLIALGLVLPMFLGQVQVLMQGVSPMHIPALLAGLTLGPVWGAAVGAITPILRGLVFGMPPLMPTGTAMAFELAAYACLTGALYPMLARRYAKNHLPAILIAMLIAMVAGRLVGGAAQAVLQTARGNAYTFSAFITAYFAKTAVGAALHLIAVPVVTLALERAHLSPLMEEHR